MSDNVKQPAHYRGMIGLETIDIIRRTLGPEGFVAYCRGNVIKYRMRAGKKGDAPECLAKADQYEAWANEGKELVGVEEGIQRVKDAMARDNPDWPADEKRIDAIGQNGGTGEHYQPPRPIS